MEGSKKRNRYNAKIDDKNIQSYMESRHTVVSKGVKYEEQQERFRNEYSVHFEINEHEKPIYEPENLHAAETFEELIEDALGLNSIEGRTLFTNIQQLLRPKDGKEEVKPTFVQQISMPYVLNAEFDVSIRAETGCGKTLAYAIPIVANVIKAKKDAKKKGKLDKLKDIYALIVVPQAHLCDQVWRVVTKLCNGLDITVFLSHTNVKVAEVKQRKKNDGINILVCELEHLEHYFLDPEDEKEPENPDKWPLHSVLYVVLDEAASLIGRLYDTEQHRGPFFDYIQPLAMWFHSKSLFDYHLIMVSALPDISSYAKLPYRPNGRMDIKFSDDLFPCECLTYKYILAKVEKTPKTDIFANWFDGLRETRELEKKKSVPRIIIFVNNEGSAGILHSLLSVNAPDVPVAIAGGFRSAVGQMMSVDEFKSSICDILITTDELAEGMDFADVEYVVNYDLPANVNTFYQRNGRCARMGNVGTIVSFFHPDTDLSIVSDLVEVEKKMVKTASFDLPDEIIKLVGSKTVVKSMQSAINAAIGNESDPDEVTPA